MNINGSPEFVEQDNDSSSSTGYHWQVNDGQPIDIPQAKRLLTPGSSAHTSFIRLIQRYGCATILTDESDGQSLESELPMVTLAYGHGTRKPHSHCGSKAYALYARSGTSRPEPTHAMKTHEYGILLFLMIDKDSRDLAKSRELLSRININNPSVSSVRKMHKLLIADLGAEVTDIFINEVLALLPEGHDKKADWNDDHSPDTGKVFAFDTQTDLHCTGTSSGSRTRAPKGKLKQLSLS